MIIMGQVIPLHQKIRPGIEWIASGRPKCILQSNVSRVWKINLNSLIYKYPSLFEKLAIELVGVPLIVQRT